MSPPQNRPQLQLDEQRQFETLLIDLSTRFVSVPADQVDKEIEDAQRRVCELLQLDASLLWQSTNLASERLNLTHIYRPIGGPSAPVQSQVEATFPWMYAQVLAGGMYVNSTLDDLPPEAAVDRIALERIGVKSNVGLPLTVGGGPPVGALTFNTVRQHRFWTEAIVRRLQLVAQIFANALARKLADAEARLRLRQLAHLNRVATVGELTGALAHELNQPLGAVLRNVEVAELLLQDAVPDLKELRAIVTDIKRDNERAGSVIDRLRLLLRQRSIELRSVNLSRLVEDVVSLAFADAMARGIRIVNEVSAEVPAVRCDSVHVQQVLLNLIVNAMDAIGASADADSLVLIRARPAEGDQVEVSVSDNGPGIAAQALPSVFDAFFTTKTGGIGLGLPISRTLIDAQGGRIWADAETGQGGRGASFHFTLPRAAVEGTH